MKEVTTIPITKDDLKNLEPFLQKHNLIDDKKIWFAGFNDAQRGQQNAVAANLFYGNKRLQIITIKDDVIYQLFNRKDGIQVTEVGLTSDKHQVHIHRGLLHPSLELHTVNDNHIMILATKNKQKVKEFKAYLKQSKKG